MQDLERLLNQAQSGDMDAFAVIVQRFQRMAGGYAFAVLGDSHLAEDAAQAAFFEAYCNLDRVYGAAALPAFLRKVVFKHCDRIARKRRLRTVPLEAVAEPADDGHPARAYERQETEGRVRAALLALPDRERQAAVLFYLCGYSRARVAELAGLSLEETVYRLRSARAQLKQRISAMEPDKDKDPVNKNRDLQAGALALAELGLDGEPPRLVEYLGRAKEHSSQGNDQNLLQHSMDVARLAASLAGQLGWDVDLARRAGLLHDIGKLAEEGPGLHMAVGARMVTEWGESVDVREVIWTHHERGRRLAAGCSLVVVSPLCFVVKMADFMAAEQYPRTAGPDGLAESGTVLRPGQWTRDGGLDPYVHRVLELDDTARALQGVAAAYLFRAERGVALLLHTTPQAGEVESLALAAAAAVRKDWGWDGPVGVTPVLVA